MLNKHIANTRIVKGITIQKFFFLYFLELVIPLQRAESTGLDSNDDDSNLVLFIVWYFVSWVDSQ